MTGETVAFFHVGPGPQTLLLHQFAAPIDRVFDAWTDGATLAKWWGPRAISVSECSVDLTEGGSYRITMQDPDGVQYPMVGTFHDIVRPERYTMLVGLDEHPAEWIAAFRPKGTPLEFVPLDWKYDISFRERHGVTTVEVLATYPVMEDCDAMISMGAEEGWGESFEKLDVLLASD